MLDEQCIPWNPIPAYANRWFELGVARFEVELRGGIEIASLVAFAPKLSRSNRGYHGLNGWLITFDHILAHRYRRIPSWNRTVSMPRPKSMDVGAWEVSPSTWLAEITPPDYPYPAHHFVLTYNESVYEVAAAGWKSEQLPDHWEAAYQLRPDHST